LYIGGGIGPKILSKLREPGFLDSFWGKGRIGDLLRSIPVRVITNDKTALLGAARVGVSGS
jgi:glucokinase